MNNRRNGLFRNSLFYILMFLSLMGIIYFFFGGNSSSQTQNIRYSEFVKQLDKNNVKNVSIQPSGGVYKVTGSYRKARTTSSANALGIKSASTKTTSFSTTMLENNSTVDQVSKLAAKHDVKVTAKAEESSGIWVTLLMYIAPVILMLFLFYMMMGQAGQGGGNNRVMNFGKTKAKPADSKQNKVRFSDVAGEEEEKQELVEVVEFLKDPRKFVSLGARIPSGVLLEGPPGTGKTLLAKAVAGEAGVPFFSISGSDFVEMFVGVGASRVRDLFEQAKKNAPSIIFIDEIDAVGRQRGNGMGGGHDEREQTLNQLLVEMDGFTGNEGVIVMAATNRSDVLDPALLRPGRFDRKILVGRPDVKGREAILKVHAKNKPLAADVDLKEIAKQTPGFVGADLENLLNEAALLAARRNKKQVDAADLDEAEDRVIAGPAKHDRVVNKHERETVAYHEAGHTIVGLVLNDARVVHKVTIVPRGRAGGYAIMLPREDQMLMSKRDAKEQMAGLMGGRAAEEIIFGAQSSGASNDFEQATQIARAMVTQYGMSEKLGPVELENANQQAAYQQGMGASAFSQHTAQLIDDEVRRLSQEAHQTATDIIESHREQHKLIAEALLKYETLDEKQILSLFKTGKMPEKDRNEFPSEKAATFEESKRELERREAEKHAQNQSADDQQVDSADTTTDASVAEPSFPSESNASSEVSADSSVNSTANSATESATDSDVATSATGLPNAESATPSSQDDTNSQA
ncbi:MULTISPECIES: ATP-dependent zinc metalloprotease FtsH [Lactiplantibacillus]|uniref:ATP-dependent zinc metalloprotease FtsH n=1 Tax=Lactiplantibacillus paraplantarum TaxID=60520 RepID=A0AAD0TV51_9LACO|nr:MULTISPECIES: ATP-dependent zinc metalloprotease FtsH [Lactiplantibacillus]AVW09467.1 ATP-dependent zinc metalloprotease FtsH [Lactiplantibacillus paraplantarum]AYJ37735.1 ATP-dependent zinc metalloprotease FtsH [Lactiplantibacillus paraplantarum]ERL43244.1 cell division protein FtsH, ATP-dependent zinc metallopeptidase [Lactiplantibacillus paraplantarum]MCT4458686.1 ATP-dependent zinc metalloprotease FtsH [Lactiplantibacillus paraplantarum]MCU4682684.1 ATP-dependent zinc metalloprotease Ft